MLTSENTFKEIEDSGVTTAVVPIGSTEQHGNNLPLATDFLLTEPVAQALAESLGAYLVPQIPIGQSEWWLAYPGSLSFSTDTMKAVVADIVNSLVKTGFETIVFVSVHGGNDVLWSGYIEQLEKQHEAVKIVNADLDHAFAEATRAAGVSDVNHADECEASMLVSIRPDLIGPEPIDYPEPKGGYPKGPIRQICPWGSLGEPSKGTKAKGDQIWETLLRVAVEDIVQQLKI